MNTLDLPCTLDAITKHIKAADPAFRISKTSFRQFIKLAELFADKEGFTIVKGDDGTVNFIPHIM